MANVSRRSETGRQKPRAALTRLPRRARKNEVVAGFLALAIFLFATSLQAQERVTFPSLDMSLTKGEPTALTGLLWKPSGAGPFAAVVMMHGCAGGVSANGRAHPVYQQWGDVFAREGYVALLVDGFRPRGYEEVCTRRERPILPSRERPYDAFGALKYLGTRGDVDLARVALAGWSHGAITALITMGEKLPQRAEVRANGLTADFHVAVAFYPGCVATAAVRWAPVAPILMLLGAKDDWTVAAPCISFAQAQAAKGQPISHVAYPDAYHGFDAPNGALHVRNDLHIPGGGTSAHVGPDPTARADALMLVPQYLAQYLK